MSFTLRIDTVYDLGPETCIRGLLVEGAYSGPEEIRLRGTTGEQRTALILKHAMIGLVGWPILPEHYTYLDLHIDTPRPPFSIDKNRLVEGLGKLDIEEAPLISLAGGTSGQGMPDAEFKSFFQDWRRRAEVLDGKVRPVVMREIDTSDPDWEQKIRRAKHPVDELGIRAEAETLFDDMIERLDRLDAIQRQMVFNFLNGCYPLMATAVVSGNPQTRDGFRKRILLFVIDDQRRDTRDAILALSDYRKMGEAQGIDVDAVFKEAAALTRRPRQVWDGIDAPPAAEGLIPRSG